MTVEHFADLVLLAHQDDRLSLRAKGLYAHLLRLPSDQKLRQRTLANGLKEGRDAVIKALKELVKNEYIFFIQQRGHDGTIDTRYELNLTGFSGNGGPGFQEMADRVFRKWRTGFSGNPENLETGFSGLGFQEKGGGFSGNGGPGFQEIRKTWKPGFQDASSSSINTEYNNNYEEEQKPPDKETPVLPINPSAAGSTQGTLPLPGAPPPPAMAPPTWWEAEVANFRTNQIQQESFCMSRRVEHCKMAALMDRFLADRVIVSDFKRSNDLWKHFLAWFNLGQAKGFIHRDGSLNDMISDGQQPEPKVKPGEIVLTRQEQRTAALVAQLTAERNARNAARAAQGG